MTDFSSTKLTLHFAEFSFTLAGGATKSLTMLLVIESLSPVLNVQL